MCGIAGFLGNGNRDDLQRMTDHLTHRGPDGAGYHVEADVPVFLGHRRLAIVDLATGDQPMWNETGDVGVIYNGEIYNHVELRRMLENLGHRFQTVGSDTEVLVHGWEEWGADLPRRLNGMFAFAIWDRRKAQLFLARDRFGEKPLYYAAKGSSFAFASELIALTKHTSVSTTIDMGALAKFFAYGYIPSPHALFKGCRKLPGGHCMTVSLSTMSVEERAYYKFVLSPDDSLEETNEDALVDELQALLSASAKRRLMSDVPVGVFLSGGIDSSLVLGSLSNGHAGDPFQTFTIGFTEKSFDESRYAKTVATHFASDHNERVLDLGNATDLTPEVLGRMDEPLGDASILPTSLLCGFAREHVTVALSGDGGDELFAGYDPFVALKLAKLYGELIPSWGHRRLRDLVGLLPKSNANMSLDFKLRRTLMGISYPEKMRLPVWMSPLEPTEVSDLLNMQVRAEDVYEDAISLWETSQSTKPVDKALEFFTRFYLQDDILTKSDRAAMMHSLETRAIFLDNEIAEFCQRLPTRFKLKGTQRKYLLKQVAKRMLPTEIVDRKKKGFGIPLQKWMRELHDVGNINIPNLNNDFATNAHAAHQSGSADYRYFLWCWLSLQYVATKNDFN
ncbi:MAG: asparagine synthase (glutamine-hydrolyzing) [Pseudomonadota bacterium]